MSLLRPLSVGITLGLACAGPTGNTPSPVDPAPDPTPDAASEAAPAPGPVVPTVAPLVAPPPRVLGLGERVVALEWYTLGTLDCGYPGLPPKLGSTVYLMWQDGFTQSFPAYPAAHGPPSGADNWRERPCRPVAEGVRVSAAAEEALRAAGVDRSQAAVWRPGAEKISLAGGHDFTSALDRSDVDDAVVLLSVTGRVDGKPVAVVNWTLAHGAAAPFVAYVLGVAEQGGRAAAVFAFGAKEEDEPPEWATLFDPAHPEAPPPHTRSARVPAPFEIQAVDLDRGLVAYRRFLLPAGDARCDYPGVGNRGIALGLFDLGSESAVERVVYATPSSGSACTSEAEAAVALAGAKARAQELGLDLVRWGTPDCHSGAGQWTVEVDGPHTLESTGRAVRWDGKEVANEPDEVVVCVDRGWVAVMGGQYLSLAESFLVSAGP